MCRIALAASRASAGVFATLMPPALPRPPACTCAFTTTVPPNARAAASASSGVVAMRPSGMLIAARLGGRGQLRRRGRPRSRVVGGGRDHLARLPAGRHLSAPVSAHGRTAPRRARALAGHRQPRNLPGCLLVAGVAVLVGAEDASQPAAELRAPARPSSVRRGREAAVLDARRRGTMARGATRQRRHAYTRVMATLAAARPTVAARSLPTFDYLYVA